LIAGNKAQQALLHHAAEQYICSGYNVNGSCAALTACSSVLLLGTAACPAAARSAAGDAALLVPPAASHDIQMPTASATVRLQAAGGCRPVMKRVSNGNSYLQDTVN
jgi:hypothetical protein